MEVYRLAKEKYADSLSGVGAARYGARWNSVGVELIYTAANRSLAMAEVAVHLTAATVPDDYFMIIIFIPDNISMQILNKSELPKYWNAFPYLKSTQTIGDEFVSGNKFCVLKIQSAVTQGDYNYLINPIHSEFKKIKIMAKEKFPFDNRIFK